MKRILTAAALIMMISAACAFAEDKPVIQTTEYSAVYVERENGKETETKVYAAHNMYRQDLKGGDEIVITRYDRKQMYIIYPKLRRYILESYPGEAPVYDPVPREGKFGDMTREFVGFETEDTYRLRKYLVTINFMGKEENRYQYHEWYRDNFPLPVKTKALKGDSETLYTNIKLRRPDIEFFMKPKRYKKVTQSEIQTLLEAQKIEEALEKSKTEKTKKKK